MISTSSKWMTFLTMSLFVLLWGSAAIVTRWALDHSSVFAVLVLRFAIALLATLLLGFLNHRWLPKQGTRWQIAGIGLLMIGCYSISYFQAMVQGITPGLLATLLGIQPILTLLITERHFSWWRLAGLLLSLVGLVLVVYQSLVLTKLSGLGMLFALGALVCITLGTLLQKQIKQAPTEVLPLQYLVTLMLCFCFVPSQPFYFEMSLDFLMPLLWLGLVTSVGSQLLLYRMIHSGNLVNVTSLLYLVPVVTVLLDYLVLGNTMPILAIVGMVIIVLGLFLVFQKHSH